MITATADRGDKALKMLRLAAQQDQPYDFLLLDYQMPGMDGIELVQHILQDPAIPFLRVVMLSSAAYDKEPRSISDAGIHRYLDKPVRQQTLHNCLAEIINIPSEQLQYPPTRKTTLSQKKSINAHILLAEDNVINQEVALNMLEIMDCKVTVVPNGEEAVQSAGDADIDLILMDCHMPKMDGFQAARKIRQQINAGDIQRQIHLPIIALTADVQEGIRDECRAAGMDDYMSKPFDQQQLEKILSTWLGFADSPAANSDINEDDAPGEAANEVDSEAPLESGPLDNIRAMQRPGAPNILRKMIDLYLSESANLMQNIKQAIETGDSDALEDAAHSLKSSSANLGAVQVSIISKKMEEFGRQKAISSARGLLDGLENHYQTACKALSREVEDSSDV